MFCSKYVVTMNDHPLGRESSRVRLEAIMGDDGVTKYGKAMVCEKVCPKKVPLMRSVTRSNREASNTLFHKNDYNLERGK